MKIETIVCDVCKVQRGETNHWWKGYRVSRTHPSGGFYLGAMIIPVDCYPSDEFGKSSQVNGLMYVADLCGQQHAIEWINSTMTEKS